MDAAIPGDALRGDPGEDLFSQQAFVGIGVLARRPAMPDAADHASTPLSKPAGQI
jgi:hypothetical protein